MLGLISFYIENFLFEVSFKLKGYHNLILVNIYMSFMVSLVRHVYGRKKSGPQA